MIFKFDDSLKSTNKDLLDSIASLLTSISKSSHNIECEPLLWEWIEKNIINNSFYLSGHNKELILKNKQLRNITQCKKKYLSVVPIGNTAEMITPSEALKFVINRPSEVVVENSENDWAVIKKWLDLMKNDRTNKEINSLVCASKDKEEIIAYQGGGGGEFVKVIKQRAKLFQRVVKYKVSYLLDSDRNSTSSQYKKGTQNIIAEAAKYYINGYILNRREMENYFPPYIYNQLGFLNNPDSYSEEQWKYVDVEKETANKYQKKYLPDLAKYLTPSSIKPYKDELQEIIFIFAKLV